VITATFPPATATVPPVVSVATATKAPLVHSLTPTKAPGVKLTQINMIDLNTGWAIGQLTSSKDDQILRSSDGGKSWKKVTPLELPLTGKTAVAFFLDATRAWVTYATQPGGAAPTQFTVWRTTDGGATWQATNTGLSGLTMEFFTPSQVAFFDANNGWLVTLLGAGMNHTYFAIYKTSDGGATWKAVVTPDKANAPMACSKSGAWFRDANHGYLAGSCNGVQKGLYLYATSDGGVTWTLVNLPAPAGLANAYTQDNNVCGADAPRFFDAQKGLILVYCADMNANKTYRWVYRTLDGGTTWTSAPLPRAFGDAYFLNSDTGWYLGQTAADVFSGVNVYQTTDGGKTWKQISGTQWAGQMDYVDAKNGWVIAKAGTDLAYVRTVDGGVSYAVISAQIVP
jgi:photosystem II stability/assembly factor-like uncharacterized protein